MIMNGDNDCWVWGAIACWVAPVKEAGACSWMLCIVLTIIWDCIAGLVAQPQYLKGLMIFIQIASSKGLCC